jgi:hypothetical protein
LTIFFRNLNAEKLKIGTDFIETPRRWKDRTKLNLNDITEIGELDTYYNVIEIKSKQGILLIERNWMNQKEFDKVKNKLKEYWMNK